MHYLVGTDSVHTTAAACDYLGERATAEDDVTVVAAVPPDADDAMSRRDAEEALNVAPVRLAAVGDVETEIREGEPTTTLLEAAADVGADEIVIGARSGEPGAPAGVGSTATSVLAEADRPVVVVPLPDL